MTDLREGLTLVVPAYDEEATLDDVVREVLAVGETLDRPFEVLVVDDGSRDRTAEVARALVDEDARVRLVRHDHNQGSGMAIRTGLAEAAQPLVIYVPADGQFVVSETARYVEAAADADIVVGVRTAREGDSAYRRLQSRVFTGLANALFGTRFRDMNWVHLWRREAFERLAPRSRGVLFLQETLVLARRAGMRIAEVDSAYAPRRGGRAKGARPSTAVAVLAEMARLRVRL